MSIAITVWPVVLRAAGPADHAVLDAGERARAAAMRRGADTFVHMRATLRRVLGAALDRAPEDVAIVIAPGGRPELAPGQDDALRFNVSHADGLGAIALARGMAVGIDVEHVRPDRRDAPARALRLGDASPDAVFAAWCETEAVAKAAGCGLPAVLAGTVPTIAGGWRTRPLHLADGYAAAVAAPGVDWTILLKETLS